MRGQLAGANQARRGAYTRKTLFSLNKTKNATLQKITRKATKSQLLIYGPNLNQLITILIKEVDETQILLSKPKKEEGSTEG